jgi:hypothetical protein
MWQFMYGSDEMFQDLERRGRRACVRFVEREMPPGTVPARAAIGFEVEARSGRVRLLVERGVVYQGASEEVERWFAEGGRTFHDMAELRSWLGSTLRDAYRSFSLSLAPEPASGSGYTGYEAEQVLDEIGIKGLHLALRAGYPKKDLPS